MKIIQKAILPAVVLSAGLFASGAQASTTAGTTITNEATLSYDVNGASGSTTATADVVIDVKIDFSAISTSTAVNDSDVYTYDSNSYYMVGQFSLSNTGNAQTDFSLTLANLDGDFTSQNYSDSDTIDATLTDYVIVPSASLSGTTITTTAPAALASGSELSLEQDMTEGNTVYVLIPTANITATDAAVLGVSLTMSATDTDTDGDRDTDDVTISETTAANTDAVEFVIADSGRDNSEIAYDAMELSAASFPEDTDGNGDATEDGFIKTATVIYDPINGALDTANGVFPKAIPGAVIEYTITVTNLGSGSANNLVVTDPIPDDTAYCTDTSIGCSVAKATAPDFYSALDTSVYTDVGTDLPVYTPVYDSTNDDVTVTYGTDFYSGYQSIITFYVTVQ